MKPSKYNVPPIDISTINHSKVKTLSAYASKVLSDNKECFVAQWVDTVEFGRFLKSNPAPEIQLLHYDKLIYDIKSCCKR